MSPDHENVQVGLAGVEKSAVTGLEYAGIYQDICGQLTGAGQELRSILSDIDPRFIHTGRELRAVAQETRELIEAIHTTAGQVSSKAGEGGVLERSGVLIENVLLKLDEHRNIVENDLDSVRDLVSQMSNYRSINESIGTISSSFRAVRINMLIQCNAQQISEDMFHDVTEDIDALSKTLKNVTGQIKQELSSSAENLIALEGKVSINQSDVDQLSAKARHVVTEAHEDIGELLKITETMIAEASSRSKTIARKVDEIVVSIQFHDSFEQRANHILESFEDITGLRLPGKDEVSQEHLGLAYLILDLQYRQLVHILDEIKLIHDRINESFSSIGAEVNGLKSIFQDSEFQSNGQETVVGSLISALLDALVQLCNQLSQGVMMTRQIQTTARDTRKVSDSLVELMEGVRDMRDQIRLQAVNTIIMASNLGDQGRTIQVLAKEINFLSDQTSELMGKVDELQENVSRKVNALCQTRSAEKEGMVCDDNALEMEEIESSYREMEKSVAAIPAQVVAATDHIHTVQADLNFMQELRDKLQAVTDQIGSARDTVLPWKDMASSDSEEIEKLVQRYTMQQERMIHMVDQEVSEETEQDEEDIFF